MKGVPPAPGAPHPHLPAVERAFFGGEISPSGRLDTEERKKIRRDRSHVELLRTSSAAPGIVQSEGAATRSATCGEVHQARTLAVILKIGRRYCRQGLPLIAVVVPDDSEARGIAIRHASQEDAVDDTEDCSVRSNAEGERQQRDDREARAATQHADSITQILENISHAQLLFVTQRDDRIAAHSAPRWQIARKYGYKRQHDRHGDERERIGHADAKQKAR